MQYFRMLFEISSNLGFTTFSSSQCRDQSFSSSKTNTLLIQLLHVFLILEESAFFIKIIVLSASKYFIYLYSTV